MVSIQILYPMDDWFLIAFLERNYQFFHSRCCSGFLLSHLLDMVYTIDNLHLYTLHHIFYKMTLYYFDVNVKLEKKTPDRFNNDSDRHINISCKEVSLRNNAVQLIEEIYGNIKVNVDPIYQFYS